MSSQIKHICTTCKKEFANHASLNIHKKSAKYCKKLQVETNHAPIEVIYKYTCEYCSKECTTSTNLKVHMKACPSKSLKEKYDQLYTRYVQLEQESLEKYNKLQEQYTKKVEEAISLKESLDWEKSQNISYNTEYKVVTRELNTLKKQFHSMEEKTREIIEEKDKCISDKDKQISYMNNQVECYKKEKDKMYDSLNIKEQEFSQKEKELRRELKQKDIELKRELTKAMNKLVNIQPSNTYIGSTVIKNAYGSEFNQMFQQLPNFTDINIKERVSTLTHEGIIYANNYDVDFNFASKLVNVVKDLTFCTDQSRGKLIIKTDDGKKKSISADNFILECIGKSKEECIKLLKTTFKYCEQQFKEKRMFEDDYNSIKAKLVTLIGCINQPTIGNNIKAMPTLVVKHCKQVSKRSMQEIEDE